MIESDVCDECSWRRKTVEYIDLHGHASRLCGRCLNRAILYRDLEIRLHNLHARLRAQQAQYRQLERLVEHYEKGATS